MKLKVLNILMFVFLGAVAQSQVVINEVSAANWNDHVDNYNDHEDWVELYNPGAAAIDLTGYYMSDDEAEPMKWEIPSGTIIGAGDFLLIYCSDRDENVGGNLHTSFKITQARQEAAVISDPSGVIVDSYVLTIANQRNHSRGRVTDGDSNWGIFTNPTPGAANVGAMGEYIPLEILTTPGYYSGSVSVEIQSADAGAEIRYTTDGTIPTLASTLYTGPVSITQTSVLRARAFNALTNALPSFIETNTYFIDDTHGVYIVSVSGDELPTLLGGQQIEPIGHFELFSSDGEFLAEASGDFNEHGNDSWAYPQRGIDYIAQDEFGYGNEVGHRIFDAKDRDGFQRLILKAAASDNYPFENGGAHIRDAYVQSLSQVADLRLDERTYAPCVMYMNGQYWGVYEIREKVDDLDFTRHYYDQGAGDVDFLKTWGATWEEYGSGDDWDDLRDFILGNDMSDAANYDYVDGLYNTGSLIDYFLLNSYIVSSDWLNWNTGWWRGRNPDGDKKKWRYILWDMDASFDHYINFTGVPDQSPNADPCDPEQLGDPGGEGHVPIWNTLLNNEEFFADYINRYSDLSTSYFSCEFLINHLDSLINLIEPEMQDHIDRWGGTMAEWQGNVQNIRDFINVRCAVLNNGFLDCYPELDGPYDVVLMADPQEGGRIDLPSFEIDTYPYDAVYFGGVPVTFDADENNGFIFSHWTSSNGTVFTPDEFSEEITVSFTSNDTLIAHFVPDVSYNLTLNVEPANSGSIEIAGTVYSSFPITIELAESVDYIANATAIAGYGFSDWLSGLSLSPSPVSENVSFSMSGNQTLTARFFEVINEVTFDVAPADVGRILLSDTALTEYPTTIEVPEIANLKLEGLPVADFHKFSHWSILNATPNPGEYSSEIEVQFTEPDVIVANFIEMPNEPITIETSPPDIGWVRLADTLLKSLPYSAQRLTEDRLAIEAIDRENYKFSHWEVKFGAGIDNKDLPLLSYSFVVPTHLIAHFEERFNAVFIPNSFTPNGDGFNDLLKVYGNEVSQENFRFAVMNRSGQEIWTTENANDGWNGAVDGSNYFVPPGIYTYFLRYRNEVTGDIVETSGSVLLIR
ncbi:MAG: CotH kinase family protein [Flavobacteriales bacterium]|nr:CotH kinase family protein [Flavobacteriales bacterium]